MRHRIGGMALAVALVAALAGCDSGSPQSSTPPSGAPSTGAAANVAAAPTTGSISGTVTWPTIDCAVYSYPSCSPPAVVVAVVAQEQPVKTWRGPLGQFTVAGLPPGTYTLTATIDEPAPSAAGQFGSLVPVQAGATTPSIDIVLQAPVGNCGLRYLNHDARVGIQGAAADRWCAKLMQLDGHWFTSNEDLTTYQQSNPSALVCSGASRGGAQWRVFDTYGQFYGQQVCATLNQLSAG